MAPYKEITENLNLIFSKPTQRNFKIFLGMLFHVGIFHFMPKYKGVKKRPKKHTLPDFFKKG